MIVLTCRSIERYMHLAIVFHDIRSRSSGLIYFDLDVII